MGKRIFVDIDSTINDHWRRIRDHTVGGWPGDTISGDAFGEAAMEDMALPHAKNILAQLVNDHDFELTFLTSRGWDLGHDVTERWLARNGFDFYKQVLKVPSHTSKVQLLEFYRPDYWVDDCISGQERLIPSVLVDLMREADDLGVRVVLPWHGWMDVLDQIERLEGWTL